MNQSRFWFILQQDVDRPIGGVKQIYTVASIIADFGYSVFVVQGTSSFRPTWFSTSDFNFRTVGSQDFSVDQLDPFVDIVVIPETFLPLLPTLSRLRVVIFNQNMHYLCGEDFSFDPALVMQAYSRPNILSVLTVSASDYNYAVDALPLPPSRIHRIVNAIEDDVFSFSFSTNSTIAYMPRKNTSHSRVVLKLIQSQSWFQDSNWSVIAINNKSHSEVASILADSSIFLSFGYPEGFGLPLAEAIVSGCPVVGYDGLGGSEIYNLCQPFGVFSPVPFRDFHSFLNGVQSFIDQYRSPSRLHSKLCQASQLVSQRYSKRYMVESIASFLQSIPS